MKISKINTALMCSHKNVEKLARRLLMKVLMQY